jgi:hypothetical protein
MLQCTVKDARSKRFSFTSVATATQIILATLPLYSQNATWRSSIANTVNVYVTDFPVVNVYVTDFPVVNGSMYNIQNDFKKRVKLIISGSFFC